MVRVTFTHKDYVLLVISVSERGLEENEGDFSWLDIEHFSPLSRRLGRRISFHEDPEEWARSLPTAYASSPLVVTASEKGHKEKKPRPLWPYFFLALCALALVFTLLSKESKQLKLPVGPPTTAVITSPHASAQYLSKAQAEDLMGPLNQLVTTYNAWRAQCVTRTCPLSTLKIMNDEANRERSEVRALETSFRKGRCRLSLATFDNQLYSFHTALDETIQHPAPGLVSLSSASSALATTISKTLPSACTAPVF